MSTGIKLNKSIARKLTGSLAHRNHSRFFFIEACEARKKISGSKSETGAGGFRPETSENPLTTCAVIDFNYSAVFNACLPRLRREKTVLRFVVCDFNNERGKNRTFSPSTRSSSRKPYKSRKEVSDKNESQAAG
jgi:hypothetical protein